MSSLPQRIPPGPIAHPLRHSERFAAPPNGFLQPLLQMMIKSKNARGGGVFAFTGPAPGVGVSYVVQLVARELALESRSRVLTSVAQQLEGGTREHVWQAASGYVQRAANVWTMLDQEQIDRAPDVLLQHIWVDMVPEDFDFVLIDCPALNQSGDALRVAPDVDGLYLVVAAGKTRRDQIDHAQKMLRYSTDRFQGLVLNRRTYPVPKFLYKFL